MSGISVAESGHNSMAKQQRQQKQIKAGTLQSSEIWLPKEIQSPICLSPTTTTR